MGDSAWFRRASSCRRSRCPTVCWSEVRRPHSAKSDPRPAHDERVCSLCQRESGVALHHGGASGVGQTIRAREIEAAWNALRLNPDEWMIPLLGDPEAGGKRDVLEGRLVWLAIRALSLESMWSWTLVCGAERSGRLSALSLGLWARRANSSTWRSTRGSRGAASKNAPHSRPSRRSQRLTMTSAGFGSYSKSRTTPSSSLRRSTRRR